MVASKQYFLLFYDVADDYLERRGEYRDEHLALARKAEADGLLVMAGALAEPADGAVLVFDTADKAVVEEFAKADPYTVAGLVKGWRVRPWTVVIGQSQ